MIVGSVVVDVATAVVVAAVANVAALPVASVDDVLRPAFAAAATVPVVAASLVVHVLVVPFAVAAGWPQQVG